jgi:hypothetical protein
MASRQYYPLDHASHLPVLIALPRFFTIRAVVEFGAGIYSTPLFLDKNIYPKLETLISEEKDPVWIEKVLAEIDPEDIRHSILNEIPETFQPSYVDLIFVDNGPREHKVQTIVDLANACDINTIVAVHDSEHPEYRSAINQFKYVFNFDSYNPETAIATNANFGETWTTIAHQIKRTIDANKLLRPDDVRSWAEIFRG